MNNWDKVGIAAAAISIAFAAGSMVVNAVTMRDNIVLAAAVKAVKGEICTGTYSVDSLLTKDRRVEVTQCNLRDRNLDLSYRKARFFNNDVLGRATAHTTALIP